MRGIRYLANSTATARPMPEDAPVTKAYPISEWADDEEEVVAEVEFDEADIDAIFFNIKS